jgi:hypothetical protein
MGLKKKGIYSAYSPWAPHTYGFVVLTSLTHPRKILFVVLQIGKAEDLSAHLCIISGFLRLVGLITLVFQIFIVMEFLSQL